MQPPTVLCRWCHTALEPTDAGWTHREVPDDRGAVCPDRRGTAEPWRVAIVLPVYDPRQLVTDLEELIPPGARTAAMSTLYAELLRATVATPDTDDPDAVAAARRLTEEA